MLTRIALIAAALMVGANAAPAAAEEPAQCDATSFRIYFDRDSASLNADARRAIDIAERAVVECGYAELNVSLAPSPLARARGAAIVAAAEDRAWDKVSVAPRSAQRVAGGPEFAEVTMTPHVTMASPAQDEEERGRDAGV
jgi:hypothetical protein